MVQDGVIRIGDKMEHQVECEVNDVKEECQQCKVEQVNDQDESVDQD